MLIANFPPDIWAYLVVYLPGEQLGRLKLTGSKCVWSKLKRSHVVKAINLGKDFLVLKRWPAFLNELPTIEELDISNHNDEWWRISSPNLSMLPATLKKLRIFASREKTAYFFFRSANSALSLDTQLPLLEVLEVNLDWSMWMSHKLPNLTRLRISDWNSPLPLPTSLTHLETWNFIPKNASTTFEFPPHLKYFSCWKLAPPEVLIPLLPETLESFKASNHIRWHFKSDLLSKLPKNLTILEANIDKSCLVDSRLFTDPEHFISFAPALTHLKLSVLPSQCWKYLPTTLITLKISSIPPTNAYITGTVFNPFTREVHNIKSYPISSIPHSITHLELAFTETTLIYSDACFSPYLEPITKPLHLFPPSLKHLSLEQGQLNANSASQLPPSLTSLHLLNFDESVSEHIPRGLTELEASQARLTPLMIKFLPKTLTSLSLRTAHTDAIWVDPYSGEVSTVELLRLKYSWFQSYNDLDWVGTSTLPDTLKRLELDTLTGLNDQFLHQGLSRLEFLSLQNSSNFTDHAVILLSRSLTLLNLPYANLVTGKSFGGLPKALTWLNIANSTDITDADVRPKVCSDSNFSFSR